MIEGAFGFVALLGVAHVCVLLFAPIWFLVLPKQVMCQYVLSSTHKFLTWPLGLTSKSEGHWRSLRVDPFSSYPLLMTPSAVQEHLGEG